MFSDNTPLNVKDEAEALASTLSQGNPEASRHLARLIEADTRGAFQPFAEALVARLCNYMGKCPELGDLDPDEILEDAVYHLLKVTAHDWDGLPHTEELGEEI
jgi:hypothetical protein